MEAKTTQHTTINERVQKLIDALKIKPNNFAESIGKTPTAVYTILSGRNKPGYDILEAIIREYPHVSPDWLFLGEGEIFRLAQRPADGGAFGKQVLEGIENLRHVFQEELKAKNHQLEAKDHQIASLQEMLKMALVGKPCDTSFGSRVVPLWPEMKKAVI